MRKIKFRVWDSLNKEYLDASDVHIDLSDGKLYEVVPVSMVSSFSAGLVSIHNQERYIIEQYTGLKDKNGVEIYEGDIVGIDMNYYHIEATVIFREDLMSFVFDYSKRIITIVADCIRKEHIEVIDNIHEVDKC